MIERVCKVSCEWDPEAQVWVATSEDIPGLVLESGSFDALLERVKIAVQELLELEKEKPKTVDFYFSSERKDKVSLYG